IERPRRVIQPGARQRRLEEAPRRGLVAWQAVGEVRRSLAVKGIEVLHQRLRRAEAGGGLVRTTRADGDQQHREGGGRLHHDNARTLDRAVISAMRRQKINRLRQRRLAFNLSSALFPGHSCFSPSVFSAAVTVLECACRSSASGSMYRSPVTTSPLAAWRARKFCAARRSL